MKTQYIILMSVYFFIFVVVSLALIPLAWIIGIVDKARMIGPDLNKVSMVINLGFFIPLGLPILMLDTVADLIYFWRNSFRTDLEKVIIKKEKSTITHRSLRELGLFALKFKEMKIRSVSSSRLIKIFRKRYNVKQNIQYLMFG